MPRDQHTNLSRRERQIMDVIYAKGQATAGDVREGLPDPPTYSTVRALLRLLEEKGHIRHRREGRKYVFIPTVAREKARCSALRNLLGTFFDDSVEQVVASLIQLKDKDMSKEDFERLLDLIEQARQKGNAS